jgi:polar amino acid transport system substrate-binding protein
MIRRRAILAAPFVASPVAAFVARPAFAQPVLKVGCTPTGIPFTFLDTKTQTIQGIMVDLITAIGKDQGFAVDLQPMVFASLVAALTSSKIDIISAAMFATPARAEIVDFSAPVYTYGEALFVPKTDAKAYTSPNDMKGFTVGAQLGTAFIEPLKQSGAFAEVKIYETIPDIMRDVNVGRLQAGFADYPIVAYNVSLGGYPNVRLVPEYKPLYTGSVAIAVRKDEGPLLAKINAAMKKFDADGTKAQILKKWGL